MVKIALRHKLIEVLRINYKPRLKRSFVLTPTSRAALVNLHKTFPAFQNGTRPEEKLN